MRLPWHRARPELYSKLEHEIRSTFHEIGVQKVGDQVSLRGSFPVMHAGEVLDRYSIEVQVAHDHPDTAPVVREIGGRIPRSLDRHVLSNGDACIMVPEEWWLLTDQNSLLPFLRGPVHNFFLGQALVERGLSWPHGQREHGMPGLYQAYGELLGLTEPKTIENYLGLIRKGTIKGHWDCPCGSGLRLRHCHFAQLRELHHRVPRKYAEGAILRIAACKKLFHGGGKQ